MTAKKQNGAVNLLKFIFALFVAVFHGTELFGSAWFGGGWVAVEFFYIFCGFTLTAHAARLDLRGPEAVGEETFKTLKKRILKIFPFLLAAAILSYILKHVFLTGFGTWKIDLIRLLPEIFMSQMAGYPGYWASGVAWFLSAMWIGIACVYPLILGWKILFTKVFAPLLAILLYGYLIVKTGSFAVPGTFMNIAFKGTLRAIAGISLGCASYHVSKALTDSGIPSKLLTAAEIAGYAVIFVIMLCIPDGEIYYYVPFAMMLLLALTSRADHPFAKRMDSGWTRFLGNASMILYLNHYYIASIIAECFPNGALYKKLGLYIVSAAVITALNILAENVIKNRRSAVKA